MALSLAGMLVLRRRLVTLKVVPIRGSNHHRQRDPAPLGQETPLDPRLRSVGGVRSGALPTQRGLGHRAIHRLPGPLDTHCVIVGEQGFRPKLLEDPCSGPFLKPVMQGRGGTEASGKGSPLYSGGQQVENALHALAVIPSRPSSPRMTGGRRQQRPNQGPELIGKAEACFDQVGVGHRGHQAFAVDPLSSPTGSTRTINWGFSDSLLAGRDKELDPDAVRVLDVRPSVFRVLHLQNSGVPGLPGFREHAI